MPCRQKVDIEYVYIEKASNTGSGIFSKSRSQCITFLFLEKDFFYDTKGFNWFPLGEILTNSQYKDMLK